MKTTRVLTGITTTGTPHLGNYVGAIRPAIAASQKPDVEAYLFLADFHALIKNQNPDEVAQSSREIAATWLALGLDPDHSFFFRQSDIPEITELSWILSCSAAKGLMNRAHAYKASVQANEAAGEDPDFGTSMGLFSYPVLMAADILLYDTTHVPVGDDQKQHLELCRDIAQKFNNDFKIDDFFKVPEPLIQKEFSRIMSLKDGSKKMSKSELSDLSRINLTDDEDQIINKIKKAKTDPLPIPKDIKEFEGRPEAQNLLGIFASLSNSTLETSIEKFAGKNFSEFKQELSELLVNKIMPISEEIKKLLQDQSYLDSILLDGVEKANKIASKKIKNIKETVGF